MYAFAPSLKRSVAAQRDRSEKSISATLMGVVGLIGAYHAGGSVAELLFWLYDQEAYWQQELVKAEEDARVAKEKLDAIAQAKQQAETEQSQGDSDAGAW